MTHRAITMVCVVDKAILSYCFRAGLNSIILPMVFGIRSPCFGGAVLSSLSTHHCFFGRRLYEGAYDFPIPREMVLLLVLRTTGSPFRIIFPAANPQFLSVLQRISVLNDAHNALRGHPLNRVSHRNVSKKTEWANFGRIAFGVGYIIECRIFSVTRKSRIELIPIAPKSRSRRRKRNIECVSQKEERVADL